MNIHATLNRISIIKQNNYDNSEGLIYRKKIDSDIPEIPLKIDIETDVIRSREDLIKYEKNADLRKNIEKIRFFLSQGCSGYLALHHGDVISSCWLCDLSRFHPNLFLNNSVFSGERCYYIFYATTKTGFRRKGIMSFIFTQIQKDLVDKGKSGFIYSAIDSGNIISEMTFEKAGFGLIGWLRHIQIFRWVLKSVFIENNKKR